ncbi:MAG: hypothetical protein ACM3QS_15310 [Bacteroidota bacterium]
MNKHPLSENDPHYHTQNVGRMIDDLITHLRNDVEKVDDPQARALFEVSAEVLGGLQKAYQHFEDRSEKAWK